jgi:hypothetical protein
MNPSVNPDPNPNDLEAASRLLARWRVPADLPDSQDRQRLKASLSAAWDSRAALNEPPDRLRWAWLILSAQVRIVHRFTWIATLLVMALGFLVTAFFTLPTAPSAAALPIALIAPLVAAFGVAFIYGIDADPALELQLAAPISPRLILLARLALVFGFNLIIGLTGSLALALISPHLTLWSLVAGWLIPMTFLSSLAFLLSVLFFEPLTSAALCLALWAALVLRSATPIPLDSVLRLLPDFLSPAYHFLLFAFSLAAVIVALWLGGRDERALRSL